MSNLIGHVASVCIGVLGESLNKQPRQTIDAKLDGFVGDRHASFQREAWGAGDKQDGGVMRRNERQWSAVSVEELTAISLHMDLVAPLTAGCLGANLCFVGVPNLSRLPRGSIFKFPSGAELMVEEYNPPCVDMAKRLASLHRTRSGQPVENNAFPQAAKYSRGLVGVIEVSGEINVGDRVAINVYQPPKWLAKLR